MSLRNAVATLALTGCIPHVTLPAPPATLTPAERVAYFQRYAPIGETRVTTCQRGACATEQSITLADGTEIHHPEDLLPLVAPDGEVAHHVHTYATRSGRGDVWQLVGLVATTVGLVYTGNRLAHELTNTDEYIVGGLFLGGFTAMFVGWRMHVAAADDKAAAFRAYPRALGERLAVCTNGFAIVPCEQPTLLPPPQPPQPIP